MNGQGKVSRMAILRVAILVFIVFLAATIPSSANGQTHPPQLPIKVGDRVEIRSVVGNPAKGKITEIGAGEWEGFIRVKLDVGDSSENGRWQSAPGIEGRFFLLGPNDGIVGDIYSPNDHQPFPPKRTPLKSPEQSEAKSGPPPLALVKRMIQGFWEEKSDTIYTLNLDLHSAEVGKPRPWRASWSGRDMGSGVPGETLVYPVRSQLTLRRYSSSGVVITEVEGVYNFYINAFQKWQCGLATSKDLKPMQTIRNP